MTDRPRLRRARTRTAMLASAAALAVLVLAGCGSRVASQTVLDLASAGQAGGAAGAGAAGAADPGGEAGAGAPGGTVAAGPGAQAGSDSGGGAGGGTAAGPARQDDDARIDVPAGDCDGFDDDQPGIDADTITIANVADISGPVPGLFESAQLATRAFAAYFNSQADICGHALVVQSLDARSDASADQQAYVTACGSSFAAVGSQSAFDYGGAQTAEDCGLPDLRAYSLSAERTACRTCYAAYAVRPDQVPEAMPTWWLEKDRAAMQKVGMLYINAGAAPQNAENFRAAWETAGWDVLVFEGHDTTEFNFAPYVQKFKNAGVEFVNYTGPYQNTVKLLQAMQQQGYAPTYFMQDATIYTQGFLDQAGDLATDVYVYNQIRLFTDTSNDEMRLYQTWLRQVDPNAQPTIYGAFAWSASRLFAETALGLGGRLTRESLLAELARVRDWTANDMHVPQQVGAKSTTSCVSVIQYDGSAWKQVSPGTPAKPFMCGGTIRTGLGG